MTTESKFDKVRETFDFTVDKFPLSGPDGMKTPFYGLFRSDTSEVVNGGSVTSRYVPHQTDDVLALVEAAEEAFDGEIDVKCHFRNGHYVSIAPTKEQRHSVFGTNDNIWPRIKLHAGYDGRAFVASMGYFRDLCKNMAELLKIKGTSVKIRHTSGLRPKMNDLISTFQTLKESWGTLTGVIDQLQSRETQLVEFLDQIYPQPEADATKRAVTVHKNRTEAIFKRLQNERYRSQRPAMGADFNVSLWEAFNAVQGYVQHDATRKSGFTGEFDRILLASRDGAVKQAESLALFHADLAA